ncbi:MAG: hypothetical protein LBU61_03285 [Coriobacteriales bacterium]|jgi:hypothetical protein|nr:hypothetical protein [Coriobacteriales bacterium]
MATLTPKENFMRVMGGQVPEWVPEFAYPGPPLIRYGRPQGAYLLFMAELQGTRFAFENPKDIWGVPFTAVPEVGGFQLPTPDQFILTDITKWHEVIKVSERLQNLDWKAVAEAELKNLPVDREQTAIFLAPHCWAGFFMSITNFMGFNEGLSAFIEEPDAVKELFDYLHQFYFGVYQQVIDIVKPDAISLGDDAAAERNPFISPLMYREFLIPLYREYTKLAIDRGIPIEMHLCGRGEDFMHDLIKIGVNAWEPVQLANDIEGLQARYGRHLVIGGGWEGRGRLTELDVTDEEIRASVRATMDKYGRNGGYMWSGSYTPMSLDDQLTMHWNEVLGAEIFEYGNKLYK